MGTFIATVQNRADLVPAAIRVVAATIDEANDELATRYDAVHRLRSESPDELYYYRPLADRGGAMLQFSGICAEESAYFPHQCAAAAPPFLPGAFIVAGYRGERVALADLSAIRFS